MSQMRFLAELVSEALKREEEVLERSMAKCSESSVRQYDEKVIHYLVLRAWRSQTRNKMHMEHECEHESAPKERQFVDFEIKDADGNCKTAFEVKMARGKTAYFGAVGDCHKLCNISSYLPSVELYAIAIAFGSDEQLARLRDVGKQFRVVWSQPQRLNLKEERLIVAVIDAREAAGAATLSAKAS